MLTLEASANRYWGPYPALRKVLENRRLPDSFFGPTSVSDNIFDWFHRTLTLSLLICEWELEIKTAAQTVGPSELIDDLGKVLDGLHAMKSKIDDTSDKVKWLLEALYRDQALKRTGQDNP